MEKLRPEANEDRSLTTKETALNEWNLDDERESWVDGPRAVKAHWQGWLERVFAPQYGESYWGSLTFRSVGPKRESWMTDDDYDKTVVAPGLGTVKRRLAEFTKRASTPMFGSSVFAVLEYGSLEGRPHGHFLWRGNEPEELVAALDHWRNVNGFVQVATLEPGWAIRYVAKYITKQPLRSSDTDWWFERSVEHGA